MRLSATWTRPGKPCPLERLWKDSLVASPAGASFGFTLMELMVVTVLLGILAMIAVPVYQSVRRDASQAAVRQQLRTLVKAQELHFAEYDFYTDEVDDLDYRPAGNLGLELRVGSAGGGGGPPGGTAPGGGPPPWAGPGGAGDGWSGRLTDSALGVRCGVFHGSVEPFEPASVEGEIACEVEGDG